MKYRIYMETTASTAITVEVADDLDDDEARDAAIDAAYENLPDLCARCSGWGQAAGIELSEWDLEEGEDAVAKVEE